MSENPSDQEGGEPRSHPSEGELQRIARLEDPVLRNLRITQAYHELGLRLSELIGGDNHTWLGFGTWASKTAGVSIRDEELPTEFRKLLAESERIAKLALEANKRHLRWLGLVSWIERHSVLKLADNVTDSVSSNLAHGNKIVFAELAPTFSRLIDLFDESEKPQNVDLAGFVASVRFEGTEEEQALARSAFLHYGQAIVERDPDVKAQLVLLANLEAVLHEQKRLQGPIEDALDAPIDETLAASVQTTMGKWVHRIGGSAPLKMVRSWLGWPFKELVAEVTQIWQKVATHHMMTLDTPERVLDLSEDVPPPQSGTMCPPALSRIEFEELTSFLKQWDRTDGTGVGSGAGDWSELGDRMNYICTLFRSRQQSPSIGTPPYSPAQVEALRQDRMPSAPL